MRPAGREGECDTRGSGEGTGAPNTGVNRWMGSVALDKQGNMAVGYSVVNGTSVFPRIRYAGRLAGDPLGQLTQAEAVLQKGSGVQTTTNSRRGNYTSSTRGTAGRSGTSARSSSQAAPEVDLAAVAAAAAQLEPGVALPLVGRRGRAADGARPPSAASPLVPRYL
jgi:hypothetical protein